uniref:Sodium/potassium-transporting ATPase subunit beta n=1 Tax=Sphenodon punctatus TaxID=8508 RepID=A0A8D0L8M5_SPHPU
PPSQSSQSLTRQGGTRKGLKEEGGLGDAHAGHHEEEMAKKTWDDMLQEVKLFLWNPETRKCMGRSAQSWGLILLFYLLLYIFLAGMFAFCMYGLMLTLNPYTPTYRDRVAPPGVVIRPYVDHGFHIAFNLAEPSSWEPYVTSMEHFLTAYDDHVQEEKNVQCTPGQYFFQDDKEGDKRQACQFKRSLLQNCSGTEDPTFGYAMGQPCILLKMNRIIGYRSGYGTPVKVDCKVQKGDESDIQSLAYYPESATFDLMYYPYYGKHTHINYTSPLVAVQFTEVRMNHTIPIQCSLNGEGIINDYSNDRFLGRIIFTLYIGM